MRRGPTELPREGRLDGRMLRRLWPFIRAWRGRALVALTMLLVAKGATVGVPLVLRALVDHFDTAAGVVVALPVGLVLAYGGMRLASSLFGELRDVLFARVRYGIIRRVSMQVVEHLHRLSLRYHLERRTGEISRDIGRGTSSMATLINYLLFNILPTFVELGLVVTILLLQYRPAFALITATTMLLYIGATFLMTEWRMKYRTAMNRSDSEASALAIDGLLNYETVQYFGNSEHEVERYADALQSWEDAAVRSQHSLSMLNVLQGSLVAIGVTLVLLLAAGEVADGAMTVGDLVAVNAFLLQLFLPLGFLGTVYSMLKHALADMERMFRLLEEEPEVSDSADAVSLRPGDGEIRFEGVHFGYDAERPILCGLDLVVPAGRRVAIVGASGAGKSTLARLLFRFYDVTDGAVRIDGQDIRTVTLASLREAIGVVPQDTVLFNASIRENIRYGRLDADAAEVEEAAGRADLLDFIARLPKGWDTVVGERGLKLSGGEKQRVAIARALLKRPRILLLDEATSSLDTKTEQAVTRALAEVTRGVTSLVIAHRLSTVVDADEIVVLEDGAVVERGTHAQLLALGGRYAELWRRQEEDGPEEPPPWHGPA
ncbi:MAG: ABC transporter ATP-binding protein/permease [Deltaproteobacteria bacterium]|nr:MAG: ABC transporter ATP-binding protein/permease [Deltaproteobacteria bacterium]